MPNRKRKLGNTNKKENELTNETIQRRTIERNYDDLKHKKRVPKKKRDQRKASKMLENRCPKEG